MGWVAGTCYAAVCDRYGIELEDQDTGGQVLFGANEKPRLEEYWGWHTTRPADGTPELICEDCWEQIGADDAVIAEAARWEQSGPDLIGGDRP